MAKVRDLREIAEYLRGLTDPVKRAGVKTMVATSVALERRAKENARKQFIGRNDRPLSGFLFNSIYSGFEQEADGEVSAFVGVRNIPYGAIHEYGGEIRPKKAKHLWIPQYKNAGKMTPREFIKLTESDPGHYHLFPKVAAKWTGQKLAGKKKWLPLFFLVDEVEIPERPYLRPAVEVEQAKIAERYAGFLKAEVGE